MTFFTGGNLLTNTDKTIIILAVNQRRYLPLSLGGAANCLASPLGAKHARMVSLCLAPTEPAGQNRSSGLRTICVPVISPPMRENRPTPTSSG